MSKKKDYIIAAILEWYLEHSAEVNKKPYFKFIDENLLES